MKTLDEKSAEYSARLCNQSGNYSKGEIETAYVTGATDSEELIDGELGSFGQALKSIQRGNLVTRKGWNGKGMFIFMRPADELHIEFVTKEIKSLPQRVKDYYYQDCIDEKGNPIDLEKDDVVKFTAYICMKAADGSIVNGWLASQSD
ncbi:DUF2829 domain-containing protein, partial [Bacteroidales bacterium OttesenSCG-928-J19]|nr:DUF2829 domain-containing protein [Bacteroidales bacterium OttesenSCG-928-J19]